MQAVTASPVTPSDPTRLLSRSRQQPLLPQPPILSLPPSITGGSSNDMPRGRGMGPRGRGQGWGQQAIGHHLQGGRGRGGRGRGGRGRGGRGRGGRGRGHGRGRSRPAPYQPSTMAS